MEDNKSTENEKKETVPTEDTQPKEQAPSSSGKPEKEEKKAKELTPQQIQKRKKLMVYPLMFLVFAGCMYLIFAPSGEADNTETKGFNSELPMPDDVGIVSDKITAYEQERSVDVQGERMKTLQDFMLDNHPEGDKGEVAVISEEANHASESTQNSFASSKQAYQNMNRQLTDFYQPEKNDPDDDQKTLELEWRIQELERKLDMAQQEKNTTNEQLALMEKSYEMAARYMGNTPGNPIAEITPGGNVQHKPSASPVSAVREHIVSGLEQPMPDSTFLMEYSRPRNLGFNTAVGTGYAMPKNTIKACVYEDQTVTDGQSVKLRLLEPLQAGDILVPRNSLVTGAARIQGERVDVEITTLEYAGNIIPVELAVHDADGSRGIYVPSSMEREALNEAMANIGAGLGSSFSFAQSSGQQLTMDVTRGLLQGASGYLGKKFRTVKVTLKAGYQVMLYAKK